MFRTSIRPAGYILAAVLAVACDKQPTDPAPVDAGVGSLQSTAATPDVAKILKHGVTPTDIQVSVGGKISRYQALVVGTVEELSPGDTAIRRVLVAWSTSGDRTIATLDVTTLANVGSFSSQYEPASDPRSRATGTWIDYVRDARYVATTGTAELGLGSLGGACHSDRIDMRCTKAVYRVFIDGLFRLYGASPDAGLPAVRIQTSAGVVNGVLITPTGISASAGAASLVRAPQRPPQRQDVRTPERKGTRRDDTRVIDKRRGGDTRRGDDRRGR